MTTSAAEAGAKAALPFHTLDVFTDQLFAGNPLAVVLDADGLDPDRMQVIAREFNLSETIFVQAPRDPAHTARVRIFFPTAEIPFAGHPTIGCAIHLACAAVEKGDFTTDLVLEEEAGLVPVRVTRQGGDVSAEFHAPVLPKPHDGQAPAELVARALDLETAEIGFADHRPAVWQGGPAFLYAPVADLATLAKARPIEPFWSQLMETGRVDSAYLYTPLAGGGYQGRMFSPTAGIPEDPATGSASAILAAQLMASNALRDGENRIPLQQGYEMGRPSQIGLTVVVTDGAVTQVRIAGTAVPVSQGVIRVPA